MASKHPYIDDATKGHFLGLVNNGDAIPLAAKKAKINIRSATRIKKKSHDHQIYNDAHNIPPLSIHDRVQVLLKSARRYTMSKVSGNQLKDTIKSDRHYREMPQIKVVQELGITALTTTVRNEIRARKVHRVKLTKKLALTNIQQA
jgi:hypothetical protein